jgi:hypothetical protein
MVGEILRCAQNDDNGKGNGSGNDNGKSEWPS